jgi:hypothetical protein
MAQNSNMPLVILVGAAAALGIYLYANQTKAEPKPETKPEPKKPDVGTGAPLGKPKVDTSRMRSDCDQWSGRAVYYFCQLRNSEAATAANPGNAAAQSGLAQARLELDQFLRTWPAQGCGNPPVYDPNPATTGYDCARAIRPDAGFKGYGDDYGAKLAEAARAGSRAGAEAYYAAALAKSGWGSGAPGSVTTGGTPDLSMLSTAEVEANWRAEQEKKRKQEAFLADFQAKLDAQNAATQAWLRQQAQGSGWTPSFQGQLRGTGADGSFGFKVGS